MTLKLGAASAEEVVDLATFTSFTQVVFAQVFDLVVSMILPVPWKRRLRIPFSPRSVQLEVVCQCQQ